jgi:hypothetical protein
MPKRAFDLSENDVANLVEPGRHFVGGVAGLALDVRAGGSRTWTLRITWIGKRMELGLGGYPGVTLLEARSEARRLRLAAAKGDDPLAARDAPTGRGALPSAKTRGVYRSAQRSAEQIAMQDLPRCAEELLEWQRSGALREDSLLREVAESWARAGEAQPLRMAELTVTRLALLRAAKTRTAT